MSTIRKMIDAISCDDFNGARDTLKASLAEYISGKRYLSNEEVFGSKYKNPNKEEQELKDEIVESSTMNPEGIYKCNNCGYGFDTTDHHHTMVDLDGDIRCPRCGSTDVEEYEEDDDE